jgi:hypothetical protein
VGEAGRGGAHFGRRRYRRVLVSYGAFAVLVGAATAVVAALGIDADLTDRGWRNAGNGVGIIAGILLFLAYLFGGYVSGRMARRAGLINGCSSSSAL